MNKFKQAADETVECDGPCGALVNPVTFEDFRMAWLHWRGHSWLSGCSHGEYSHGRSIIRTKAKGEVHAD